MQAPDGTVRDLTPGENLKAIFHGWAKDDASFFISTNERDPRFFDVYEVTTDGYERTLIYRNDEGYLFTAISPNKRYLALLKSHTWADSDVYLYDRETGELRNLTPHEGEVYNIAMDFTPDGSGLLIVTDEGREFRYLVRQDLATGRRDTLVATDWDVTYAQYSRRGNYLVVAINNDARTEIRMYDRDMRPVGLPAPPVGEITSVEFSPDERRIAYYVSSSRIPHDLFVQGMGGGAPRQLTASLNPAIEPEDLVEGEVVRFASYDGLEIPGILYRPHQASRATPVPALVWVHGGPNAQYHLGYDPRIQYLVNHGYAVYAINYRGSTGYGKTFAKMDDRRHGEADLGDVVASKRMLIETGWVDPERIGIIGESYGGFMVLAALAFQPEEFDVGVDMFGVANSIRTLESIPPWWEAMRKVLYTEMGDPATDRERLERVSPLFHASNIVKPLIVLQGANDPRVLKVESDEIVQAVRANGVPVGYIVFDDEGHGLLKKENQLRGYEAILRFLDRHLKGMQQEVAAQQR